MRNPAWTFFSPWQPMQFFSIEWQRHFAKAVIQAAKAASLLAV
jgi:hypothetical protein